MKLLLFLVLYSMLLNAFKFVKNGFVNFTLNDDFSTEDFRYNYIYISYFQWQHNFPSLLIKCIRVRLHRKIYQEINFDRNFSWLYLISSQINIQIEINSELFDYTWNWYTQFQELFRFLNFVMNSVLLKFSQLFYCLEI